MIPFDRKLTVIFRRQATSSDVLVSLYDHDTSVACETAVKDLGKVSAPLHWSDVVGQALAANLWAMFEHDDGEDYRI